MSCNRTLELNNLQYLFNQTNPVFDPVLTKLLDGEVSLFKRPKSRQWYCRFKLATGKWYVASTGQEDLQLAKVPAIETYHRIQKRVDRGLSPTQSTFSQIAMAELENMEKIKANGSGRVTYNDYAFAIKKYLLPFFGKYEAGAITEDVIRDFEAWRVSQMGKIPVGSTKRNHASAFNRVIKLAIKKGFISDVGAPTLDAKGKPSQARPAFSKEEINYLLEYMVEWEQTGRMAIERLMHPVCRAYVEFLLYTGARHGTEVTPLRWKNIQWHWIEDQKYLRIWVTGKTGPRFLIGRHKLKETFERLMQWQKLPYTTLDELIEARLDRLIFCYADGRAPHRMEGVFRKLMRDSGLAKDVAGRNRTLYSLRHTYATFALTEGVDIHTLARQMGTSVAMLERHYSKLTPMMNADKLA